MSKEQALLGALFFGGTSTLLYLGWAYFWKLLDREDMMGAMLFYAGSNVCLLAPVIAELIRPK